METQDKILLKQVSKKNGIFSWIKKMLIFLIIIGLIGGGIYYYYFIYNKAPQDTVKAPTTQRYTVGKEDLSISIENDGKIKNTAIVSLNFGVDGTMTDLYFKKGDKVKKGDVIAKLDQSSYDLQIKKAEQSLDIAKTNYEQKKIGTTTTYDLEIAKKNLDNTKASVEDTKRQNDASIKNAENSLVLAQSNLTKVMNNIGSTIKVSDASLTQANLDITIAENNIEIAKNNQANSLITQDNSVKKSYDSLVYNMGIAINKTRNAMTEVNRIIETHKTDWSYGIEYIFSVEKSDIRDNVRNYYWDTILLLNKLSSDYDDVDINSDQSKITEKMNIVFDMLKKADLTLKNTNDGILATIPSNYFNQETKLSMKSNFNSLMLDIESQYNTINSNKNDISTNESNKAKQIDSDKNSVLSAENNLATKKQALENLKTQQSSGTTGNDDQILNAKKQVETAQRNLDNAKADAEAKVKSAENQVSISEEQLNQKLTPVNAIDLALSQKQIELAQLSLEDTKNTLKDTLLIAPIDGEVMQINNSVGESVKRDSTSTNPVAIIVNKNNFEMEVNIEESDISKIQTDQKVYVTLEALDNVKIEGKVYFVSSLSSTTSNGIVTYLVKIILDSKDVPIRDGMTAYAEFVLNEAKNVLTVPVPAVKNKNGKPSVQNVNNEWIPVTTGFTDGKKVEIKTGLNEGDTILYSAG